MKSPRISISLTDDLQRAIDDHRIRLIVEGGGQTPSEAEVARDLMRAGIEALREKDGQRTRSHWFVEVGAEVGRRAG